MTRIRSSLGKYVAQEPAGDDELDRMARAAWRSGRGLWLPMRVIERLSEMDKRFIEAIGDEQYGKRRA